MKLERAKQRMQELEEALKSFYETKPYRFSGKPDLQARRVVYTMDFVADVPDAIPLDKHRLILTVGSAVRSIDIGDYLRQAGPPGSMLSKMQWFSAFFQGEVGEDDYPLEVGTVVLTDETTTEIRKPTLRFQVVICEKGVIEDKPLHDTLREMINVVEKVIADFQPFLT